MLTFIMNKFYGIIKNNPKIERTIRQLINDILDYKEVILNPYPKNCLDIKKSNIKKILLFSYGGTGDLALFSSFTSYLRKSYPKAQITNLVVKNHNIEYVASLDLNIDRVIGIKVPRFFNFSFLKKIKNKYQYDLFITLNLYPDLRYLMPNIKAIHMPYFIYRDIPIHTPTPRLVLDFKIKENNYIFLNFDMIAFNFSQNYLTQEEIEKLISFLTSKFPNFTFVVNDFEKRIKTRGKNLILFRGKYKELLKIVSGAPLFISFRNGLCDVIAASTKNKKMLIIYPDQNYPGKWGVPFIRTFGMKEIGYPHYIEEYIFNKIKDKNLSTLQNKIKNFIKKNYGKK